MKLPIFQSTIQEFMLMQTRWASILNPLFGNTSNQNSNASTGSGVTQEFVFNSGLVTAAGASDTTSFGVGSNGTPILNINSTTPSFNLTSFVCTFTNPVLPTDILIFETLVFNSNAWVNDPSMNLTFVNTTAYGAAVLGSTTNTRQVTVYFGNGGVNAIGNASYAGVGGSPWSNLSTPHLSVPYRWRVRKLSLSS